MTPGVHEAPPVIAAVVVAEIRGLVKKQAVFGQGRDEGGAVLRFVVDEDAVEIKEDAAGTGHAER